MSKEVADAVLQPTDDELTDEDVFRLWHRCPTCHRRAAVSQRHDYRVNLGGNS